MKYTRDEIITQAKERIRLRLINEYRELLINEGHDLRSISKLVYFYGEQTLEEMLGDGSIYIEELLYEEFKMSPKEIEIEKQKAWEECNIS